jgi:hypothetical protein
LGFLLVGAGVAAVVAAEHVAAQVARHGVDVEFGRAGQEQVVAAAVERVAGLDGDVAPAARVARHFETADHAVAVQVTVVQAVFPDDVIAERLQIFFREELTGKEGGARKALIVTGRAADLAAHAHRGRRTAAAAAATTAPASAPAARTAATAAARFGTFRHGVHHLSSTFPNRHRQKILPVLGLSLAVACCRLLSSSP